MSEDAPVVALAEAVRTLEFAHCFNPWRDRCAREDRQDAARIRFDTLRRMLGAARRVQLDAIWVGRDLGWRGGRRTGLAFTDDLHRAEHLARWGLQAPSPVRDERIAEQTAKAVWGLLRQIRQPVFLWNLFPLHPHRPGEDFSNRPHNGQERSAGEEILLQLIELLQPERLVAVGADARQALERLAGERPSFAVRHPSHGGQGKFRARIEALYSL